MKPYPEYKATGLHWLPQIPKHWELLHLRNLLSVFSEKNHPEKPLLSVVREKGIILRNIEDKEENHNYIPDDLANYKLVKVGQFAMNKMKAWQGSYGISAYEGIVSPAYFVFNLKGVTPSFFHRAIRSKAYVSYFGQASDGIRVGQWDLSLPRMREIPFFIPPVDEQTQIVRYLDAMTAKINKLIRTKKKQIALLQEQKQAIINQAVTKGLDPNVEMKDSGIGWLGKIPEGWNISALKRALAAPMVDGPHETPEFVAEGIPFVSAEASHDGRIHLSECRGYISPDIHRKYCQKIKPRRNDIFIVKSGSTTGKTVLVDFDDEFSIWSPLALVRCRHNVNYKFVFYALSSSYFQKEVQDNWSYGTQPNIGMGVLKSLPIALPSPKIQAIIADFLDDISASIDKTRTTCQNEIFFLQEYKNSLVSAAVTGEMDIRGLAVEDVLPEDATIDDEEAGEDVEEEMTEAESEA